MASHIEKQFVQALFELAPQSGFSLVIHRPGMDPLNPKESTPKILPADAGVHKGYCLVFPQARIRQYKIDVALLFGDQDHLAVTPLAVECDGHEWHERTPQQAAYDRARDRDLLRYARIPTIRFTGSEIVRDANQCAEETIAIVSAMHNQAHQSLLAGCERALELRTQEPESTPG
jgi:very-short-patch-repair endonuclease